MPNLGDAHVVIRCARAPPAIESRRRARIEVYDPHWIGQGICIGNFRIVAKSLTWFGIPEDDWPIATLDGNNAGRVVLVEFSGSNVPTQLTLMDLAITQGAAIDLGGGVINDVGGGIYNNHGSVRLMGSTTVSENRAAYGGGIASYGDLLLDDNVRVTNNAATIDGGGIYNVGGVLTLDRSASVTGNTAGGVGGGIFNIGPIGACSGWVGAVSPNTPDDPPVIPTISFC